MVMRISVFSFSRRNSVRISAVKSGADFRSDLGSGLGVWVAMRVYAGMLSLMIGQVWSAPGLGTRDRRGAGRRCLLEMGELCLGCVPHLDSVSIVADELLQVCGQREAVSLKAAARFADALGNVEDDAGEAILVDVDFLVVRDLAQLAATQKRSG